jgi:hypothetical protein
MRSVLELPRAGKFDLAALARRYQMSGGYIRNAALRAAFHETGTLAESGQLE